MTYGGMHAESSSWQFTVALRFDLACRMITPLSIADAMAGRLAKWYVRAVDPQVTAIGGAVATPYSTPNNSVRPRQCAGNAVYARHKRSKTLRHGLTTSFELDRCDVFDLKKR